MLKCLALLLLFLGLISPVNADEQAVAKYRDYLPEEIAALSAEERRSSVPMMYTMVAGFEPGPETDLVFGLLLNKLMYPGLHDIEAAKKSFQKDLGEPQTGRLTVGQIHDLNYFAELQSVGKVHFPDHFIHYDLGMRAFVSGTVTILDDRIAYPINHVEITCIKSSMECEYEQLVMIMPDKDSWAQIPFVNKFDTETYRVTRWENGQIDAVPASQSPSACRMNTLNLNFNTDEFFEIVRNTATECDTILGELEPLKKPRISQIVDGAEIHQKEFADFQRKAFEVWSSEVRQRIEALQPSE